MTDYKEELNDVIVKLANGFPTVHYTCEHDDVEEADIAQYLGSEYSVELSSSFVFDTYTITVRSRKPYELLELIPGRILAEVKIRHPGLELPSEISYKIPASGLDYRFDVASVTWDANNFVFIVRSDGNWSYEDRDGYMHGQAVELTNILWVNILMACGHTLRDAAQAFSAWQHLLKHRPTVEDLIGLEKNNEIS